MLHLDLLLLELTIQWVCSQFMGNRLSETSVLCAIQFSSLGGTSSWGDINHDHHHHYSHAVHSFGPLQQDGKATGVLFILQSANVSWLHSDSISTALHLHSISISHESFGYTIETKNDQYFWKKNKIFIFAPRQKKNKKSSLPYSSSAARSLLASWRPTNQPSLKSRIFQHDMQIQV